MSPSDYASSVGGAPLDVLIELCGPPGEADKEQMYFAAQNLTNDIKTLAITESQRKGNILVAEFTVNDAKQGDVVNKIGKGFTYVLENYSDSFISFPKRRTTARKKNQAEKKEPPKKYTSKQGQYLAFIYYYTQLNDCPPAEHDMQKYFKTTSAAIHGMVVQLDKKGLIARKPGQARSIKLLLSRDELPDLA